MAGKPVTSPGWWEQRWLQYARDALLGWCPPETRLRGARRTRARLQLARGRITATVEAGSHGRTATVTCKVKPLSARDWRRGLDAVAADPAVAHRLLSGTPGPEFEAAFAAVGVPLFPAPTVTHPLLCTCREQWDCRHVLALLVHFAQQVVANPFLWLEVLGQGRAEVLAAVRARLADSGGAAAAAPPDAAMSAAPGAERPLDCGRFWATAVDPEGIPVRPGSAVVAVDALLRLLGPLPLTDETGRIELLVEREIVRGGKAWRLWDRQEQPAHELLKAYVADIRAAAADLSRGERSPDHREETLPGKPIPPPARLAAEVEEAVLQAGTPLSAAQLRAACPTAAALPAPVADRALSATLAGLPPELTVLAGRYVGQRAGYLAGMTFRHVITFDEWRSGRLRPDADWVRALEAVGCPPPYRVQFDTHQFTVLVPDEDRSDLFALLRLDIGDALQLTVSDPAGPVLAATRIGLEQRDLLEPLAADGAALAVLLAYMAETQSHNLSEMVAVAVLLGEGLGRGGLYPDPVWLLPAQAPGLYIAGTHRALTTEQWRRWTPAFARGHHGYWSQREQMIRWFTSSCATWGVSLRQVEEAQACVQWWCRYWPHEQDRPGGQTPPLAALLHFLWNVVPIEVSRQRMAPERVPIILRAWFAFLGQQVPALQATYGEHMAVCDLTRAYAHRLQTVPSALSGEAVRLAWQMEGLRWLGPERYFG